MLRDDSDASRSERFFETSAMLRDQGNSWRREPDKSDA